MKRPLEGKRALVTGAGTRLGKAIALALGEAGCTVAVHHHTSVAGAQQTVAKLTKQGRDAFAIRADLTAREDCEKMFEELDAKFDGKLDVLVNSAGIFEKTPIEEITPSRWQWIFQVNVEAALWCAQLAHVRMKKKGGSIVNVVDVSAERPWAGYAHYCASKAALVSLTKSMAIEWAPEIRVNAVAPGAVLPPDSMTAEEKKKLAAAIPQKRLGDASDVAATVVFLVSGPEFLTGAVIPVDGGRSARF